MKENLCILSFFVSAGVTVAVQVLTKSVCHLLTADKGLFYVTVDLSLAGRRKQPLLFPFFLLFSLLPRPLLRV